MNQLLPSILVKYEKEMDRWEKAVTEEAEAIIMAEAVDREEQVAVYVRCYIEAVNRARYNSSSA
jgi:hypothetical protein